MPSLSRLARSLDAHGARQVDVAVVLGSGLGAVADRVERAFAIPFAEIEDLPGIGVPGHAGRVVLGDLAGARVLVQVGRVHLYEGHGAAVVSRSVRAFAEIGCRAVVLTSAAGGLREGWTIPTLMRIVDHVNLQGASPLAAREGGSGSPYDPLLGEALDHGAREAGVRLERGVYAGVLGPSYETAAEVRMLSWLGADAVGMSTVCEAQAARAAGLRVAAVSCITNHAARIAREPLRHDDVLEAGRSATAELALLLERSIPRILAALRGPRRSY